MIIQRCIRNISVGNRIYFSVLSVFLLFAIAFIVFQQSHENRYKTDMLDIRLQDYNERMSEWMNYTDSINENTLNIYVKSHGFTGLRVTLIKRDGTVVYDSWLSSYANVVNHSDRPEVIDALKNGHGTSVDRSSRTVDGNFFYSASYFKDKDIIIRSALPYDDNLSKSLQADQHYIWFAITAMVLLTLVLYHFISRLGDNITKLKIFASRADNNESLDTEDLADFPDDELGEIAERIIKIYKRLQSTREEQTILKRQLTQNIAHELKTPVASIQGYLETILSNPDMDAKVKQQFMERSYAQSRRLTSLLHDISTLNRMDDAHELIEFSEVNVSNIIGDIERDTSMQLEQKHMSFVCDVRPNILIEGNYSLVYSIFRNLTDNAIAYAGEHTTISVSARETADRWMFSFCDNGVGVSAEHLPRLFERFYRVDKGRSRKMGGTGLGLAIVKNAVLLHGGTIKAHNRLSGGLCFDFSLKKRK